MPYSGKYRTRTHNPKSFGPQDRHQYKTKFDSNRYPQQYRHNVDHVHVRNRPQVFKEQLRHRAPQADAGNINNRLFMGDLDPQWTEQTIRDIWRKLGEPNVMVRVMHRQQNPSMNQGYCFVEFGTREAANGALARNGTEIPGFPGMKLRLNWATLSGNRVKQTSGNDNVIGSNNNTASNNGIGNSNSNDYSIFVGDLAQDVDERQLFDFFARSFPSTEHAKVMRDPLTGVSRGYGFVKFRHIDDWKRVLGDTQEFTLNGRVLKVGPSSGSKRLSAALAGTKRGNSSLIGGTGVGVATVAGKSSSLTVPQSQFMTPIQQRPIMTHFTDCYNTTLFVEGLSAAVAEEDLREYFEPFGVITHLEIKFKGPLRDTREHTSPLDEHHSKSRKDTQFYGFVQFLRRRAAEVAMEKLQGYVVENYPMRISWGKLYRIPQPFIGERVYVPYENSLATTNGKADTKEAQKQYMLPGFV